MDKPTMMISPLQAGVPAAGGAVDMLVRLRAPQRPEGLKTQHQAKRLALVVDRSGSMSGQPLEEALRCVEHIASHLTPQDAMSLVVYDDKVDVLLPMQPVKSMDAVRQAIAGVQSGGMTNLHGGWQAGTQQLLGVGNHAIARVILLSDGQANVGVTDLTDIEHQCRQWLDRGISTTTVGLGQGFNEDLMIGMARAGGGQNYYGQTAADLYDSFDEELALLQSMMLRDIELKLIPAQGVLVEMLSPVVQQAQGGWRMTDLAWGAESWVAVRLHLSASTVGDVRDLLGASVTCTGTEGEVQKLFAPVLQLPALDAAGLAALPHDETVHTRLEELAFAKASGELRELVAKGDRKATQAALAKLQTRFGDHPWLKAKIEQLRELAEHNVEMMGKEVLYSMHRMSRRLVASDEAAFTRDEMESLEMPAFLRKKVSEGKGKQAPH